ncbi:MAG: hypothetical protein ACRDZ7_07315 [Acidimicrobiia bacterium]
MPARHPQPAGASGIGTGSPLREQLALRVPLHRGAAPGGVPTKKKPGSDEAFAKTRTDRLTRSPSRKWKVMTSSPALGPVKATNEQTRATEALLAPELARRMGATVGDIEVQAVTAAIVDAVVVAVEHWAEQGGALPDLVDQALAALEERLVSRRQGDPAAPGQAVAGRPRGRLVASPATVFETRFLRVRYSSLHLNS